MGKNVFLTCLIAEIVFLGYSCRKNKCEEPFDIQQSEIVATFKNSVGSYLYTEVNPLYNKDSLAVFDEYGNRLSVLSQLKTIPNTVSGYWEISFGNIYNNQTDSASFNSELCKKFIIKYKYNETDTIQTCFKSSKTNCGSVFQSLKIYHKGVVIKEVQNTFLAFVTITKN